jgi:hypothetical protein
MLIPSSNVNDRHSGRNGNGRHGAGHRQKISNISWLLDELDAHDRRRRQQLDELRHWRDRIYFIAREYGVGPTGLRVMATLRNGGGGHGR